MIESPFYRAVRAQASAMRRAAFDASPQWSLGQLIDALEAVEDKTAQVRFDFGYLAPTRLDSYRGYYDELALGYADLHQVTVQEVLDDCLAAVGKTLTGYKGGDYVMSRETPVWVANRGNTGSTAVTGLIATWEVIIETRYCDS